MVGSAEGRPRGTSRGHVCHRPATLSAVSGTRTAWISTMPVRPGHDQTLGYPPAREIHGIGGCWHRGSRSCCNLATYRPSGVTRRAGQDRDRPLMVGSAEGRPCGTSRGRGHDPSVTRGPEGTENCCAPSFRQDQRGLVCTDDHGRPRWSRRSGRERGGARRLAGRPSLGRPERSRTSAQAGPAARPASACWSTGIRAGAAAGGGRRRGPRGLPPGRLPGTRHHDADRGPASRPGCPGASSGHPAMPGSRPPRAPVHAGRSTKTHRRPW
jgi:hypothetical protein